MHWQMLLRFAIKTFVHHLPALHPTGFISGRALSVKNNRRKQWQEYGTAMLIMANGPTGPRFPKGWKRMAFLGKYTKMKSAQVWVLKAKKMHGLQTLRIIPWSFFHSTM